MKSHNPTSSRLLFYSTTALWNLTNGMMMILVPLYALSLDFSVLKIGSVIALPVLVTLGMRFVGGALCDRFGERLILQLCYLLSVFSVLLLLQAKGFSSLFLSQVVANCSRSIFWTAAQSLTTQLPGPNVGKRLGHLAAWNHVGNLLGISMGGTLAALLGYYGSFLVLIGMSVTCVLLGLFLPRVERKPSGRTVWQITAGIGRLVRYPRVWLGIFSSFGAALPSTLTQSLFPVYLSQLNYGEQWIGLTVSGRGVGTVAIVLILGPLITPPRLMGFFFLGTTGLGIFVASSGLLEELYLLGPCIVAVGAAGGVLDLWYQVQATESSEARDRSMAMATTSLGWPLSLIIAPLLLGWLADTKGFQFTFVVTGMFFVLVAVVSRLWHLGVRQKAALKPDLG
ncbi:MAG: MFS transporter [Deltaproteobacteria bacterium]|nr:MFS transporter [Deltaproteobacteria bacterium]